MEIDLDPGESIEAVLGKETFFPIKFNGFDVGPISVRVTVRKGETGEQAYLRAWTAASVAFAAQFDLKMSQYFDRLVRVDDSTESRRKRG